MILVPSYLLVSVAPLLATIVAAPGLRLLLLVCYLHVSHVLVHVITTPVGKSEGIAPL